MDDRTKTLIRTDPAAYRDRLRIECDGKVRRLADVLDPWQRADFEALDPGWQAVAGVEPKRRPVLRAYLERPRGHSKTTDLAISASWAIFAAGRRIFGVVAAGDRDQARLSLNAIDMLCRCNPPLAEALEVQRSAVVHRTTGSELAVISSDSATSWGLLPGFVLVDEVTHWADGNGETLFHSLLSAAGKRATCLAAVISNAGLGMGSTWQWKAREAARCDERWHFSRLDGPVASWITPEILAEQERFLPPSAFRRYWLNEWLSAAGDALDYDSIAAAVTLEGPELRPDPRCRYFVGMDLATKRDHAAIVVLAADPDQQRVRLAHCESWAPIAGGQIDLTAVMDTTYAVARRFNADVYADPHQAVLGLQQLRARGLTCTEVPYTGKSLDRMVSSLLQVFRERRIALYDDRQLVRDIGRLSIVPKSWGFKLEAPRDSQTGHADRAFALVTCLPATLDYAMSGIGSTIIIDGPFIGVGSSFGRPYGGPPSRF